jgi:FAD/FMN-containing dehydrogenase
MSKFIKMEVVMVVAAWAANSFGNYLPLQGGNGLMSRYSQSANVTADLSARLSPQAKVYLPGDAGFASHVPRWSAFATPDFTITVEVANENDVVETIKYANANKRPFLAVNNAHGGISTVGRVQNGIQINMQRIKGVKIAADGKTATFGAGILAKDVIDGLWAAGKQTGKRFS